MKRQKRNQNKILIGSLATVGTIAGITGGVQLTKNKKPVIKTTTKIANKGVEKFYYEICDYNYNPVKCILKEEKPFNTTFIGSSPVYKSSSTSKSTIEYKPASSIEKWRENVLKLTLEEKQVEFAKLIKSGSDSKAAFLAHHIALKTKNNVNDLKTWEAQLNGWKKEGLVEKYGIKIQEIEDKVKSLKVKEGRLKILVKRFEYLYEKYKENENQKYTVEIKEIVNELINDHGLQVDARHNNIWQADSTRKEIKKLDIKANINRVSSEGYYSRIGTKENNINFYSSFTNLELKKAWDGFHQTNESPLELAKKLEIYQEILKRFPEIEKGFKLFHYTENMKWQSPLTQKWLSGFLGEKLQNSPVNKLIDIEGKYKPSTVSYIKNQEHLLNIVNKRLDSLNSPYSNDMIQHLEQRKGKETHNKNKEWWINKLETEKTDYKKLIKKEANRLLDPLFELEHNFRNSDNIIENNEHLIKIINKRIELLNTDYFNYVINHLEKRKGKETHNKNKDWWINKLETEKTNYETLIQREKNRLLEIQREKNRLLEIQRIDYLTNWLKNASPFDKKIRAYMLKDKFKNKKDEQVWWYEAQLKKMKEQNLKGMYGFTIKDFEDRIKEVKQYLKSKNLAKATN